MKKDTLAKIFWFAVYAFAIGSSVADLIESKTILRASIELSLILIMSYGFYKYFIRPSSIWDRQDNDWWT